MLQLSKHTDKQDIKGPQIILDEDQETIHILDILYKSRECWNYLRLSDNPERDFQYLLDIGTVCVQRIKNASDMDFIERRIQNLTVTFNKRIHSFEETVKKYLTENLNKNFSLEQAESPVAKISMVFQGYSKELLQKQKVLAESFDPNRKNSYLSAVQDHINNFEIELSKKLNSKQNDSLPAQLAKILDIYVGEHGKVQQALNLTSKESPLNQLQQAMFKKLQELKEEILILKVLKSVEDEVNAIQEGFKFEDEVQMVLDKVASYNIGDEVHNVTEITGEIGKLGDFIYAFSEGGSAVIECRDRKRNPLTKILEDSKLSIVNRAFYNPKACIYVVRDANTQLHK